jgi:ParB family chromosome partitioning protein
MPCLEKLLSQASLPTVAQFRGQLEQISRALSSAIFDKGECTSCSHNSGNQQALFGEAIAAGHCTHGACFDGKTEAALDAKKASLATTIRPFGSFVPARTSRSCDCVAEGDTGVGEEQAKACRACKNFGAAISAVPGKLGNVYPDLCFDASCNAKKVAARIKLEKDKATPAEGSARTAIRQDGNPCQVGKGKPDAKSEAKVQDSQRVKDYRLEVWRKALRRELMGNRDNNLTVLIALALSGNARHISDTKLGKAFAAITKQDFTSFVFKADEAARLVAQSDEAVRDKMFLGLAASAADGIEEKTLVQTPHLSRDRSRAALEALRRVSQAAHQERNRGDVRRNRLEGRHGRGICQGHERQEGRHRQGAVERGGLPLRGQGAAVDALQHRVRLFLSTQRGDHVPRKGRGAPAFSLWRYHHVFSGT